MSQVIGQAWKEVVGCRNWPVMRVPLFIALRRNGIQDTLLLAHNGNELIKCWLSIVLNEAGQITWDGVVFN